MVDFVDYYSVMGVAPSASADEVRQAYLRQAKYLHPDMDRSAGAAERFGQLHEAYRCLVDPVARAAHDRVLAERRRAPWDGVEAGVEPDEYDAVEPEATADEDSRRYAAAAAARLLRVISVRAPRFLLSRRLRVPFERLDPCRQCRGSGVRLDRGAGQPGGPYEPGDPRLMCPVCWGSGRAMARRMLALVYATRRVLGGRITLTAEGDVGIRCAARGELQVDIITPDHTWGGVALPAVVAAVCVLMFLLPIVWEIVVSGE